MSRALQLILVAIAAMPMGVGAMAAEVTPDRLLGAAGEPENWLLPHGTYDANRFSALAEIDRSNLQSLKVLFQVLLGGPSQGSGNYAAARPVNPLVEDGFLYVMDGWGKVVKIDLHDRVTDRVVWESELFQNDVDSWLRASRGLALYQDFVIAIAADGRVHWIDQETGELVQSAQVDDPSTGYSIVAPPLVVGDRIVIGGGGQSRAARGQVAALDATSGSLRWRTYSVPAPGEDGSETWLGGDSWMSGGGTFEQTGSYDPATGLTFWTAGGPLPLLEAEFRPGDNLFTNSTLALDAGTGEIRWYFQHTPGDSRGFSEAATRLVIPSLGALVGFARNGYFFRLDAAGGAFDLGVAYTPGLSWTAGIDPDTGIPVEYDPAAAVQTYRAVDPDAVPPGCPNVLSTPAFAAAYSPLTGLAYGAGADGCLAPVVPSRTRTDSGWLGGYYASAANLTGQLAAVDPATGDVAAQARMEFPLHAGALATAGHLVWTTSAEGSLHALDDRTLELLWERKFTTLTPAPPITFAVDGRQRIALVLGGNAFASRLSYQPPELIAMQPLLVLMVLGLE